MISVMWRPRKLTQGQIEERRLEGGRLLRAGRLTRAEIAQRLGVSLRAVQHWARQLRDHPAPGLRALRHRMAKHFRLIIREGVLEWTRAEESIQQEKLLDGIYVIRTSEPSER